nr:uncharacterized protein LOC110358873 isoform X2 [Columba livia]XP_021143408.1 uncharacterized protein LOC110358873 isoform X2 [Columba livia]
MSHSRWKVRVPTRRKRYSHKEIFSSDVVACSEVRSLVSAPAKGPAQWCGGCDKALCYLAERSDERTRGFRSQHRTSKSLQPCRAPSCLHDQLSRLFWGKFCMRLLVTAPVQEKGLPAQHAPHLVTCQTPFPIYEYKLGLFLNTPQTDSDPPSTIKKHIAKRDSMNCSELWYSTVSHDVKQEASVIKTNNQTEYALVNVPKRKENIASTEDHSEYDYVLIT